jgi:hypothetical protein
MGTKLVNHMLSLSAIRKESFKVAVKPSRLDCEIILKGYTAEK